MGGFKAFAIEEDHHLLTVLRYIERNPVRANLVDRAEVWPWSSAAPADALGDETRPKPILDPGPVPRPDAWLQYVNEPQTEAEVERLHECLRRGRPYGSVAWMTQTARQLGLEATLRPLGRPKKVTPEQTDLFEAENDN